VEVAESPPWPTEVVWPPSMAKPFFYFFGLAF
jgi:hypothetical protein